MHIRGVPVSSIVLDVNGISFALQAVILLAFGAWADIGTWRSVYGVVTFASIA